MQSSARTSSADPEELERIRAVGVEVVIAD
jgi:hypothetical protein